MTSSGCSLSIHAHKHDRCPERHRALYCILIILNVTVVLVAIVALVRGREAEDGSKGCRPSATEEADTAVAPLSVPCSMVESNITKQKEEGGGSWMRYTDAVGDELCSPLDYRHLTSAVALIFRTMLEEETAYLKRNPPEYLSYASYDNPITLKEILLFTNQYKPVGHVTGTSPFVEETSRCSICGKTNDVFMVNDWPLRVEYYRSYTHGYVERMRWGLAVPVSGVYRVYSSVKFFFTDPMSRQGKDDTKEEVPIIHQISRYHARDGTFSVITERSHSASTARTDGLTSFLVHLTHLDVGDVICISMSFASDTVVYNRWHTEGLALVN